MEKRIGRYILREEPHTISKTPGWFVYKGNNPIPISEHAYRSAAEKAIRRHQRADTKGNDAN